MARHLEGESGDPLALLEAWYASHCDGEWEHRWGVQIQTLDNPGWLVRIGLAGTGLEGRAFPPRERDSTEGWISCQVDGSEWVGAGGPGQLRRILTIFVDWAKAEGR